MVLKRPPPRTGNKVLLRSCRVFVYHRGHPPQWFVAHPDTAWSMAAKAMNNPTVTGVAVHPEVWGAI